MKYSFYKEEIMLDVPLNQPILIKFTEYFKQKKIFVDKF